VVPGIRANPNPPVVGDTPLNQPANTAAVYAMNGAATIALGDSFNKNFGANLKDHQKNIVSFYTTYSK
jgi:hypothetical protein